MTYAFLGCLFVSVVSFSTAEKIVFEPIDTPSNAKNNPVSGVFDTCTVVGYVMCVAFTFALAIFVVFHAYLVAKGRTTIELYEIADPQRASRVALYDLGPALNFRRACGNVPFCWLFPTRAYIEGDGLSYERVGDDDFDEQV